MSHRSSRDDESISAKSSRLFTTPLTPPNYGALLKAEANGTFAVTCHICGFLHKIDKPCSSRPKWPPSVFYSKKCELCLGHHPEGHCYFEYLKPHVLNSSYCDSCDLEHTGFCKTALFCTNCNSHHNHKGGCDKVTKVDLSNNECTSCGLFHVYHCPQDLAQIKSDIILWCNLCKIRHKYMNCSPFCLKCYRHHRTGECPSQDTYCSHCNRCHESANDCEKSNTKVKKIKKQKEQRFCANYP